jgi:hypothetical protein
MVTCLATAAKIASDKGGAILKATHAALLKEAGLSGRIGCILVVLGATLFASWLPTAAAQPAIHISFEESDVGKPPTGWTSRNGNAAEVYSVRSEGGKTFLHADARGSAVQIGHEIAWSLKELPLLQWQWRAVLFPLNGDERRKATNDSVLGLYVVFGRWPFIKAIKYIWSESLPVGTSLDSPFSSRTKLVVLESGQGLAGRWVTERRDVLADFHRLFGDGETAPAARGIGLLTDADNTNSRAIGDYGDMEIFGADQRQQRVKAATDKGSDKP